MGGIRSPRPPWRRPSWETLFCAREIRKERYLTTPSRMENRALDHPAEKRETYRPPTPVTAPLGSTHLPQLEVKQTQFGGKRISGTWEYADEINAAILPFSTDYLPLNAIFGIFYQPNA